MSSLSVPNGQDADAHHNNLAVDRNVVVGRNVTVPRVNANLIESNEVISRNILVDNLYVNFINGEPPGSGEGSDSKEIPDFINMNLIALPGSSIMPDATIPNSVGVFSKYYDLGVSGITSAWVSVPVFLSDQPIYNTITGTASSTSTSIMTYVTENFSEAKRYGGNNVEKQPDGTVVGLNNLRKSYADLGNYLFGTYGVPEAEWVFPATIPTTYYVQAMYLDNSNPTTRLVIDLFRKTTTIASGFNPDNNNLLVYYM